MIIPGGISAADRTSHVCGPNARMGVASHFMASAQFCNMIFVHPKGKFWSLYTMFPKLFWGGLVPGIRMAHASSCLSMWNLNPYPFPCRPRTNPTHDWNFVESEVIFGISPGIQMTLYSALSRPACVFGVKKSLLNPDLARRRSSIASSTVMCTCTVMAWTGVAGALLFRRDLPHTAWIPCERPSFSNCFLTMAAGFVVMNFQSSSFQSSLYMVTATKLHVSDGTCFGSPCLCWMTLAPSWTSVPVRSTIWWSVLKLGNVISSDVKPWCTEMGPSTRSPNSSALIFWPSRTQTSAWAALRMHTPQDCGTI